MSIMKNSKWMSLWRFPRLHWVPVSAMTFLWACLCPLSLFASDEVLFIDDVLPILELHCVGCHSEDDAEGGLALDSYEALMKGGETGLSVTAGEPGSSRLLLLASGKMEPVMPPDDADGPSDEELAILAAWVEQGAIGPKGHPPLRRTLRTPEIATAEGVVSAITAVDANEPSQLAAVARFGGVSVTDAEGIEVCRITGFPGKVNGLEFAVDGKQILIASGLTGAFGEAYLIDLEKALSNSVGNVVNVSLADAGDGCVTFQGHRDAIYEVAISHDGTRVATGSYDRQVILWDAKSGQIRHQLKGHNGAIFDVAFAPDDRVLATASADETVKIWDVKSGNRVATLGQPEGEVHCVEFTPDADVLVAVSADNRLRAWKYFGADPSRLPKLVATRFIDETSLVAMKILPAGKGFVVISEAGNIKIVDRETWGIVKELESLGDSANDLAIAAGGGSVLIAMNDGRLVNRKLKRTWGNQEPVRDSEVAIPPVFMKFGDPIHSNESQLRSSIDQRTLPTLQRNSTVMGTIGEPAEVDRYKWSASRGEVWAIDVDAISDAKEATAVASGDRSTRLDPVVQIENDRGNIVERVRLQAVRDSYFTFRGKDSMQSADFRMFAWQEMKLNDFLYAAGEVTKLWMHPRGPDSGFNVYPGTGNRWTYFGTSHSVHALGEPAYIVRPLQADESPMANGLPVFSIGYRNDDDPSRLAGKISRLLFQTPADGDYTVALTDTRGEGGPDYGYRLRVRPAAPDFVASLESPEKSLLVGAGREFSVRIRRLDGFDGPVTFRIESLPVGVRSSGPITVEAGQESAVGVIWIDPDSELAKSGEVSGVQPVATAVATINGLRVEKAVGKLVLPAIQRDLPHAVPRIRIGHSESASGGVADQWPTLRIRRGQTVTATVELARRPEFDAEVRFGKEFAGRNAAHGVVVDNIGLSGLLVLKGESERELFITADPESARGRRLFHLKAEIDGGVTSMPIWIEVE
ncbi:MAG: c-type cytochrome domain-containing protein [Planctomycetota bacterium]